MARKPVTPGITYKRARRIPPEQLDDLWRSIGWWKGEGYPPLLAESLAYSHGVVSAWDDERLVGLANAITDRYRTVFFPYLAVHADYQGRGIGAEIVRRIQSRYMGLKQVLLSNAEAVGFYERAGFKVAGGPGMKIDRSQ